MDTTFTYPFPMPTNYQAPGIPSTQPQPTTPPSKVEALIKKNKERIVPKLFQPITLGNVTLKNRIVVSPMCQYSSVDGFMNDWHLVHHGTFAKGGAALILFEASAVCPQGRISVHDSGIWKDEHIAPLKRIVDFVHNFKAVAGIQIAHAGRKASTVPPFLDNGRALMKEDKGGWSNVEGASPIAFNSEMLVPHELTCDEIKRVIEQFKQAAIRVDKAGFGAVEIHGAHGYLIDSFLSPTSNKRTDDYGGSFEGRTRLLMEIVGAVRGVWPCDKLLMVRVSCEEWVDDGWHIDDTVRLAKMLKEAGIDVLDCSSGGNSSTQHIKVAPLYQVPFAERVKREVAGLGVSAVGLINTPEEAISVLEQDRADLIMLARPLLRDPFWPLHAATSLGLDVDCCLQYTMGKYT
ncbi:hypothetical protein SAMD00019534_068460 [Acytostelium subglobosum LB1]|uniref:hypothetical protein n=1 Tax=Acytostelium subglobosum LB1 TaxID=1410327 RepID=UPI000644EED5|nr:hypothetical protein SAMD00019534_068460 [Acytostelium subglobosum LB1]GAM23671.1 hypothetical protein SAMD00019534_068460 [Acytostelium subglobosum LB1]|eukprot:XP_012753412.1 hypothetical protein SAMD00019534_068460 [Acytostelium subglobosum LB1]